MRRLAPRPLSLALEGVLADAEPATLLGRAQALWPEAAGPALAPFAGPSSEREGVLTVSCESAVWAQELELLAPDLLSRLNAGLAAAGAGTVTRLRFVVGSPPNRS